MMLIKLKNKSRLPKRRQNTLLRTPHCSSFGEVAQDKYIALRWGMGDDCIVVFKINDEEPILFPGMIEYKEARKVNIYHRAGLKAIKDME
jgi:hypothetical protein